MKGIVSRRKKPTQINSVYDRRTNQATRAISDKETLIRRGKVLAVDTFREG